VAVDKGGGEWWLHDGLRGGQNCAAPFSIIGSIGVVAQIPNFNRFLKNKEIDIDCTRRVSTNAP
jgi:serine protease SohB